MNKFPQSLGTSLNRGFIVPGSTFLSGVLFLTLYWSNKIFFQKWWSWWPSQLIKRYQLQHLIKDQPHEIHAWKGFESMSFAIPVQRATQLSYKANGTLIRTERIKCNEENHSRCIWFDFGGPPIVSNRTIAPDVSISCTIIAIITSM